MQQETTLMRFDDLCDVAQRVGLAQHLDYLRPLAREAIHLTPSSCSGGTGGLTKLGGAPELPPGAAWPVHPQAPYSFLAQFDLSAFPASALPPTGLLSLFYLEDTDGDLSWDTPGFVTALYTATPERLEPLPSPHQTESVDAIFLDFSIVTDLPRNSHQAPNWPLDEKATERYQDELGPYTFSRSGHLLGYPQNWTLAYDPTPGPDWMPLLCLPSFKELNWCWNDGDALTVFIRRSALAEADFSDLRCDAG